MTWLLVFLLVAVILLLCEPVENRSRALAHLAFIGAVMWLAVKIDFDGLMEGLLALAWQHRREVILGAGGATLFGTFAYVIYAGHQDRLDNRAIRKEWTESQGTVRTKLDGRVRRLMELGYDRDRAEAAALKIAKGTENHIATNGK